MKNSINTTHEKPLPYAWLGWAKAGQGWAIALALLLSSCNNNGDKADAYGNFEADEIIISAKAQGELLNFNVIEGQTLKAGAVVGYVDTVNLHLQRAELRASLQATTAQKENIAAQIAVAKDELTRVKKDQQRIEKMHAQKAATQKQLDDINSAVSVAQNRLQVLQTQYPAIEAQVATIAAKSDLLEKMIADAVITNPVNGVVLAKLVEQHEMTAPGKPLYKIADMEFLNLRAFVAGSQLAALEVGKTYHVKIDGPDGEMLNYDGELIWVSETAEFTPKTIQTKKDRVDLVYAIKLRVKNDGKLKLGMPGEVWISGGE
jgi:HlyD family secretion protein